MRLGMNNESVCIKKNSIARAMVGSYLPEDVLVEVLARLPVKTLLQFRSVSKSWRDILKDPSFITKHYHTRAASNHGTTVLTRRLRLRIKQFTLMSDDAQAIKFSDLNLPFFEKELQKNECLEVAGPINGVVLVSNMNGDIYLWNPATRKSKALPCSSYHSWLPKKFCRVGFGIDPITKVYKAVRIWILRDFYKARETVEEVEVFSLSADSCKPTSNTWKIIDAIPPLHSFHTDPSDIVYLKGKCYWLVMNRSHTGGRSAGIVWFDLGDEVFGFIELSKVCSDLMDHVDYNRLVVLKGSIAMIQCYEFGLYQIRTMNECDSGVSWTDYATFGGPLSRDSYLLGLWKGEELVLQVDDVLWMVRIPSGEVVWYDTKTRETEGIYLDEYLPIANYNESLVSVMGED